MRVYTSPHSHICVFREEMFYNSAGGNHTSSYASNHTKQASSARGSRDSNVSMLSNASVAGSEVNEDIQAFNEAKEQLLKRRREQEEKKKMSER